MGYETGINLDGLIEVSKCVQEIIGRELPGQVMKTGQWDHQLQGHHTVEERLAGAGLLGCKPLSAFPGPLLGGPE